MDEKHAETTQRTEFDFYLPGMPAMSETPGRVERFLTKLFRRGGTLRRVVGRKF